MNPMEQIEEQMKIMSQAIPRTLVVGRIETRS